GTQKVVSAVNNVDGAMQNVGSMLSGNAGSLLEKGTSALSSLFSGSALSGLVNGVSKFSGLGGAAVKNLLGSLPPAPLRPPARPRALGWGFRGKAGQRQGADQPVLRGKSQHRRRPAVRVLDDRRAGGECPRLRGQGCGGPGPANGQLRDEVALAHSRSRSAG